MIEDFAFRSYSMQTLQNTIRNMEAYVRKMILNGCLLYVDISPTHEMVPL